MLNYEVQYLNNPHSIVSGDFIWSSESEDDRTFILFGDCTGHGVSASMVAVMVNSLIAQRLTTENSLSGIMDALRVFYVYCVKALGTLPDLFFFRSLGTSFL